MPSMIGYPKAAVERAMKVQDVMLQALAKKNNVVAGHAGGLQRHGAPAPGRELSA